MPWDAGDLAEEWVTESTRCQIVASLPSTPLPSVPLPFCSCRQIQCVDLESLHISATTLIYQLMVLTDTIFDLIPAAQGMAPSDRGD